MDYRNHGINSPLPTTSYGGAALMNASATPVRDTISTALDAQSNQIVGLFEVVNKLESVLIPVLGPPAPAADTASTPPPPNGVLEMVRANNRSIAYAQARIGELIDRLHI